MKKMNLPPRLQRKMLRHPRRLVPVIEKIPDGFMTGDQGFVAMSVVENLHRVRMKGFDSLSPEERQEARSEMKTS